MPAEESKIVGSWFPTGYYGHSRSKPRSDFACEFRQLAKPQLPGKFVSRSLKPVKRHEFSVHDNRDHLISSALYFEQGLGKRRLPGKTYPFNQDFYTWMPLKEEIERDRPQISTYQLDFTRGGGGVRQLPVERPITSLDGLPTTTYRCAHGTTDPNLLQLRRMADTAIQLTSYCRQQEGHKAASKCLDTVATCLNWSRPSATAVPRRAVSFVPRPPQTEYPVATADAAHTAVVVKAENAVAENTVQQGLCLAE